MKSNDPLLALFLEAATDEERERCIEALLATRVDPMVAKIASRFRSARFALTAEDAEDLRSAVHIRVLQRLRSLILVSGDAIERLDDYVATVAYRAVYDMERRRFPNRTRLKNRTRYLLKHDPRFDVWLAEEGSLCALKSFGRSSKPRPVPAGSVDGGPERAADAVYSLLKKAGGPVALDDVVDALSGAWAITDALPVAVACDPVVRPRETNLETHERLSTLWREIVLLRPNQRAALLLNLRDSHGGNALGFIHLLGLATFHQIAEAVTLSPGDLAGVWNQLPLDDNAIAVRLGLTRQQVINLRKAARERLARRTEWS